MIPELWRNRDKAEIIIGSRYVKGGATENPAVLILMSRVLNYAYQFAFRLPASDVSNSLRLYRGHQSRSLHLVSNTLISLRKYLIRLVSGRAHSTVLEIPMTFEQRKAGESKRNLPAFMLSYLSSMKKMQRFRREELAKQRSAGRVGVNILAYSGDRGCGFCRQQPHSGVAAARDRVVVLKFHPSRNTRELRLASIHRRFEFFHGDVRSSQDLESILRRHEVECVFHLAGQVAMTTSLANPRRDFEVNVLGSINLLEAVRLHAPEATVVYASSNKVYGELEDCELVELPKPLRARGKKGVDEHARLEFYTPYGCSKGAADQYMLEYARNFGLNTVVFRHSTIYGGRQISTFDQGWVGWFCQQALETKYHTATPFTINGNGKQVRDLLHVSDAVACYLGGA